MTSWRDVPPEHAAAWRRLFSVAGHHLVNGPCPVCSAAVLYRYLHTDRTGRFDWDGELFVGRGRAWHWCRACRTFEHFSALIPDWWPNEITVDDSRLTADPGAPEEAIHALEERP